MSKNIPSHVWVGYLVNCQARDASLKHFAEFCLAITRMAMDINAAPSDVGSDFDLSNTAFGQPELDSLESYYAFVKKYAQVFLRKSVVLLYVKYGVD
ncbi:hypothetical protein BN1708_019614, partial [Verticillium longisporum]